MKLLCASLLLLLPLAWLAGCSGSSTDQPAQPKGLADALASANATQAKVDPDKVQQDAPNWLKPQVRGRSSTPVTSTGNQPGTASSAQPKSTPTVTTASAGDSQLVGEWHVVRATMDGKEAAEMKSAKVVLTKTTMSIQPGGGRPAETTPMEVNPRANPKTIDIIGKNNGQPVTLLGIYRMTESQLEICMGEMDGSRPTAFGDRPSALYLQRGPAPADVATVSPVESPPATPEDATSESVGERQRIDPKFGTADEAYETYRRAMLNHDWETAFEAYLPEYQALCCAQRVERCVTTPPRGTPEEKERATQGLTATLTRYGLVLKQLGSFNIIQEKVDSSPNKQSLYVDASKWLDEQQGLVPADQYWLDMKTKESQVLGDVAVFTFANSLNKNRLEPILFIKTADRWGFNPARTNDFWNSMVMAGRDKSDAEKLALAFQTLEAAQSGRAGKKKPTSAGDSSAITLRKTIKVLNGSGILQFGISPDGTQVAVRGPGPVQIWDIAQGEKVSEIEIPGGGEKPRHKPVVAWSPDGKQLAAGVEEELFLYSFAAGKWSKPLYKLSLQDNDFESLQWLGNDKMLLTITDLDAGRAELIQIPSGKSLMKEPLKFITKPTAVMTSDAHWLVTGNRNGVTITDKQNGGEPLGTAIGIDNQTDNTGLALTPDGNLYAKTQGKVVALGAVKDREVKAYPYFEIDGISNFLGFTPDGSKLVSVGTNIHVFDLPKSNLIGQVKTSSQNAALSPTGKVLITCNERAEMFIYDLNITLGEPLVKTPATSGSPSSTPTASGAGETPAKLRTWTSADGKSTIKAKLQKLEANVAHLEREDGTVAKVPVDKLSAADQEFLKGM